MGRRFLEIFNETKDDVYRLVYSYMRNGYDTDDVVQNVFVKLYRQLPRLNDDEHIKRWLVWVAINECKSHFLSSWRKKTRPIDEIDEDLRAPESPGADSGVLRAVLALPQKYRAVVHLYYYEQYSVREIAQALKIKESAVQTRLQRAREKLRNALKEESGDEH
jgi:RNA polymerase sigma-70 factor (ECF subfamily)